MAETYFDSQYTGQQIEDGITTARAARAVNGIMKGNGSGGVSMAVAGTDYTAPATFNTHASRHATGGADPLSKSDIGLGNVDNKSEATIKSDFEGTIASGNTGFVKGGDAYTALGLKLTAPTNTPSAGDVVKYDADTGLPKWGQGGGGGGVTDYNDLTSRPQIGGVTLTGNKTASDLGLASASDLAGKQDVINDLSTIRSGAALGATAYQMPAGGVPVTHGGTGATSASDARASLGVSPVGWLYIDNTNYEIIVDSSATAGIAGKIIIVPES